MGVPSSNGHDDAFKEGATTQARALHSARMHACVMDALPLSVYVAPDAVERWDSTPANRVLRMSLLPTSTAATGTAAGTATGIQVTPQLGGEPTFTTPGSSEKLPLPKVATATPPSVDAAGVLTFDPRGWGLEPGSQVQIQYRLAPSQKLVPIWVTIGEAIVGRSPEPPSCCMRRVA